MGPGREVDLDRAIELNPKEAGASVSRGRLWRALGEWEKACRDCDEALRLDPKNRVAYLDRAWARIHLGQLDAALVDCDKAIELNPNAGEGHYVRAWALHEKQDWPKVIAECEAAIRMKATCADLFVICGNARACCAEPDYERALADYAEALKLDPNNVLALDDRALLRATCPEAKWRDGKNAVKDAQRACELTKWRDGKSVEFLAAAHAEAGDFDEAVKLQKWVLGDPTYAAARGDDARERLKLYEQKKPFRLPEK